MTAPPAPLTGPPQPWRRLGLPLALLALALLGWGIGMYLASLDALYSGRSNNRALLHTLRMESELCGASDPAQAWSLLCNPESKYPPLFYLSALLFRKMALVRDDRLASLTMMLAFLLALDCGFYLLLRVRLTRNWALLGTALLGLSPGVLANVAIFSPDLPCIGMLALALGLAAKTAPFERSRDTLVLAAVCGAGMMLYYSMPVFLIGPIAFALILALRENPGKHLRVLGQLALFLLIAALICAPYYLSSPALEWAAGRTQTFSIPEGQAQGQQYALPLRALLWFFIYPISLLGSLWLIAFPLMLLIALFGRRTLLPQEENRRQWLRPNHVGGMLGLTALIALIFFAVYGHKDVSYLFPLYPIVAYPFCLALADEFFQKRRRLSVGLAVCAIVLGVSFTLISAPRFPQRSVDRVIDPLVQQCQGAHPPCLVVTHYCTPFRNVLLQVNRGWDARRMWIQNPLPPAQGGPAAESIDFLLIEKRRQDPGRMELHPLDEACAFIPQLDPQTGEVSRLIYHGRDVTEMFEQQARADGTDNSLILYRQRNSRLPQ